MYGLDHLEEYTAVGDIDGSTSQLLVEGGVVEQIEILEQEQTDGLIIGVECQQGAQLIERVAVQAFGVLGQFCNVHCFLCVGGYHCATEALNIWSQRSFIIWVTSSSCTELSDMVESNDFWAVNCFSKSCL